LTFQIFETQATSALDNESEKVVQAALDHLQVRESTFKTNLKTARGTL
jgi:ABC-type multidrug transport system fused ATPase/permease subunit